MMENKDSIKSATSHNIKRTMKMLTKAHTLMERDVGWMSCEKSDKMHDADVKRRKTMCAIRSAILELAYYEELV